MYFYGILTEIFRVAIEGVGVIKYKKSPQKEKKMQKGQMFLIGALIIVGVLVILRYNINYPNAAEEKKLIETSFENKMFNNVIKEFNNTIQFSYDEPLNITSNVFDFANFTELKIGEHSMTFKFFFLGALTNITSGILNITTINMLDEDIDVNLTLDGQSDTQTDIANYGVWGTSFTITPGNSYTLTITYDETTENVSINTKSNKDVYTGFFYILLESEHASHETRYQKSIDID